MPVKPNEKEEEYFAKIEFEKRRKLIEAKQKAIEEAEKARLKELHYMRCPKCGMHLDEIEHHGVRIDKCFNCEGVWLDAGELETIVELDKKASDKVLRIFRRT